MKEIGQNLEPEPLVEKLNKHWNDLCQRLNINKDQNSFNEIVKNYSESHRHYHNLKHIDNSLGEFELIKDKLNNPEAVELAIWYHDIVYNLYESDNEEQSAELAKTFCQKNNLSPDFTKQVEDHILFTKHTSLINNSDSQYLADIDMSILGKQPDIFDIYEKQIYKEYSTLYSKADYQKGRTKFFKTILKHPIYTTDFFKNRYEQAARDNIQRTINKLEQ
ncbi:MAG TPA: hypothetical protein PK257_02120 [Candidatus Woesebacteria bacterium]|nr:hypothetical protein [Candidatus Woesebacteria bacterium]